MEAIAACLTCFSEPGDNHTCIFSELTLMRLGGLISVSVRLTCETCFYTCLTYQLSVFLSLVFLSPLFRSLYSSHKIHLSRHISSSQFSACLPACLSAVGQNVVLWYFTKILAEHNPTLFLCLSELNLVVIVKAWRVTVRVLLLLQDACLSVCLSVYLSLPSLSVYPLT